MKEITADLFLDDFEAEARTHIETVENAFLDANALADDSKMINSVFRAAHSLKGTAGFFSLAKVVSVAHELESVFIHLKDGDLSIDSDIVELVLQSVDCLKDLIDCLGDDDNINTDSILSELRRFSSTAVQDSDVAVEDIKMPFDFESSITETALKNAMQHGHKVYYIHISFNRSLGKFYDHPEALINSFFSVGDVIEAIVSGTGNERSDINIIKRQSDTVMTAEINEALMLHDTSILELLVTSILDFDLFSMAIEIDKKHVRLLHKEAIFKRDGPGGVKTQADKPDAVQADKKALNQASGFYIRLDISVINGLLDLANEMILTRNQLFSVLSGYQDSIADLAPILHDMNRLTSEIQEKVMFTRMQPVSVIFNKFPRIIHDTAKALKKDITVEIIKGDVALDKYLLESLTDPITQIVKNSADHGIESAERRVAAGKPKKGAITLTAYMQDGSAIIEIKDDGAGIDINALKRKAIERGVTTEEALSVMTINEVYNLMFEPGISTANQVTNLSGRGVGMDIVKTNIEKLGGSIEIESELGTGTAVKLIMPLTLSVIRTLIVTIDSISYAVPEINVERVVRIWNNTSSKRIERVNKSLVLSLDGRIIPVVTMTEIEAKSRGRKPASPDAILERSQRDGVIKCLVLRADGRSFALLIDDALETEQILVKPLPVYFQRCSCYSNVTVLGSGKAVMVLDAEGIMRFMGVDHIERELAEAEADVSVAVDEAKGESGEKQHILFTCSGSEYYAVDIENISRIETISVGDIQEVGRGQFINIAGETIRVIRPEDFAPVKKRSYADEKLHLLTMNNTASPVGLLVRHVLDKVEDDFIIDEGQVYSDYVYGTCAYNERVLIFLNAAVIAEDVENDKVKKKIRRITPLEVT